MKLPLLIVAAATVFLALGASAQNTGPSAQVFPKVSFDAQAAKSQLEPGTSSIRGTIFANENKALIKSLNLSKSRYAYQGTTVTLMPYTPYLDEWRGLQKTKPRNGKASRALLSSEAYSYRILTKVTDDKGSFEFKNLKAGKYYIYAEVNFAVAGTHLEQTGSVDTVDVFTGQVLASTATYAGHGYAVDITKAAFAVVEIAKEGQIVETKVTGQ